MLMRCPLRKKLKPESSEKEVRAHGRWQQISEQYLNFVLILFDQNKQEVLYWVNYLDTEKLLRHLQESANGYRKADQLC